MLTHRREEVERSNDEKGNYRRPQIFPHMNDSYIFGQMYVCIYAYYIGYTIYMCA